MVSRDSLLALMAEPHEKFQPACTSPQVHVRKLTFYCPNVVFWFCMYEEWLLAQKTYLCSPFFLKHAWFVNTYFSFAYQRISQ